MGEGWRGLGGRRRRLSITTLFVPSGSCTILSGFASAKQKVNIVYRFIGRVRVSSGKKHHVFRYSAIHGVAHKGLFGGGSIH